MKKLPEEFIAQLTALGHEAYLNLPKVIESEERIVSVRSNPSKTIPGEALFENMSPVEWNPSGHYLSERPNFTLDPRIHQGRYYVQEASSMAVSCAIKAAADSLRDDTDGPIKYLDACAAPGGKTTAALDTLPADSFIVANEYDPRRAQILIENLAKWGAEAFITRGDAATMRFPKDFFDIISADVPCSGEGMMRKDDFAIEQWSPALVEECASRQVEIVDNLWKALSPGGFLIYSTCTFNFKENEEVIAYLIENHEAIPIEVPLCSNDVVGTLGGYSFPAYRFVPGKVKGEGLFMAMLRKPGKHKPFRVNVKSKPQNIKLPVDIKKLVEGDYSLVSADPIRLVRKAHVGFYEYLAKNIKPLVAGIKPGVVKGKDFIPSQQLAMTRSFRRGTYPEAEVDTATALAYLSREAVALPEEAPKGIVLLTYRDYPLGWVKNLGTRANNLYPDTWRIRNKTT